MTGKEFLRAVSNGEIDLLQKLLDVLSESGTPYCVIGGLAVNAYAEPVVSLDLDVAVAIGEIDRVLETLVSRGLKKEQFEHKVNLSAPGSDLRVQLQTDPRYQEFISRSAEREVLGYRMKVAAVEDVLQGKIWAFEDETRRKSKRQKDLADILRLIESYPELEDSLPPAILERIA
jgi:hypothetical protein